MIFWRNEGGKEDFGLGLGEGLGVEGEGGTATGVCSILVGREGGFVFVVRKVGEGGISVGTLGRIRPLKWEIGVEVVEGAEGAEGARSRVVRGEEVEEDDDRGGEDGGEGRALEGFIREAALVVGGLGGAEGGRARRAGEAKVKGRRGELELCASRVERQLLRTGFVGDVEKKAILTWCALLRCILSSRG